jgi:hypothetical protein
VSIPSTEASSRVARPALRREVATVRAAAAVLWAIAFLLALHGQRTLTGSDIPVLAGLLLAAYPVIDAIAAAWEWGRLDTDRSALRAGIAVDGLAIIALLVATLGFHTQAVLIAFGFWAIASGLLQLARGWHVERSRRAQLPLILSGGISTIAGVSFAAMAMQHVAHLSRLGAYAVLGAVFYVIWTLIDRMSNRPSERPRYNGRSR